MAKASKRIASVSEAIKAYGGEKPMAKAFKLPVREIKEWSRMVAHLGSVHTMNIPFIDLCWRSVAFYASYLFEHENDGRTYTNLQADPEASFQNCLNDGREYYDRLRDFGNNA